MQVLGEGSVGRVAQNHKNPGVRYFSGNVAGSCFRPQVSGCSFANGGFTARLSEETYVVFPIGYHAAEQMIALWSIEIFPQLALLAQSTGEYFVGAVFRPELRRKVTRFLDPAHVYLRMLVEIVIKRRSARFGRSRKKKR